MSHASHAGVGMFLVLHSISSANAFFAAGLALTIALLFVGAMLLLTGAFVAFFIEIRVATAALRIGLPRAGA